MTEGVKYFLERHKEMDIPSASVAMARIFASDLRSAVRFSSNRHSRQGAYSRAWSLIRTGAGLVSAHGDEILQVVLDLMNISQSSHP